MRALASLTLCLAACASGGAGRESNPWEDLGRGKESGPVFHLGGTVRHVELEGGLFVIDAADGTRYVPTNLPPDYQIDGLPLEAEARRRDDMASIAMVAPLIELVRIRKAAAGTPSGAAWLVGTTWRLEGLPDTPVVDSAAPTLEFPSEGQVAGNASCNRFTGTVTIAGAAITFGPQAVTRMACPEAVMSQESAYLEALAKAERFRTEGPFLYIYSAGREEPIRFFRR
ncbi:MAG TPA: META domain-containing protein [Gemmatimonadales bacterium]|nr:META domain-containing protein [Gemmatimonadales bacterium]